MWIWVKEYFLRKLPILKWAKEYNLDKAITDFVGGVTVGLTLIPQVIAYASMAGLEPQYGLYASLCGGFIYLFFGTIPEIIVAPTAILSLLCEAYTEHISFSRVKAAILLAFLSGSIQIVCGLLQLGLLTNFVSTPVISAFITAAALTIGSSQIKNLLGLKFDRGYELFKVWKNIVMHIHQCKLWDSVLGITCCIVLILVMELKVFAAPLFDAPGEERQPTRKKLLYLLILLRNALVVIISTALAYGLNYQGLKPFQLTGNVSVAWPNVALPSFEIHQENKTMYFQDVFSEIATGVIFIPFLDMLSIVGIGRAFAQGKVLDASQEMFAVGLCNVIGSFLSGYPVSASFSRAAVARTSGVRTPFAGIYTGIMILLAFSLLTPYFPYLPKATLAAVIIAAVVFMVDVKIILKIWKVSKLDLIPFLATFISSIAFGLEIGILVGIVVDLLKFLLSTHPKILTDTQLTKMESTSMTLTPSSSVFYFFAEYVRSNVLKISSSKEIARVIIDWQRIDRLDYTTALVFKELVKDLQTNNKEVRFVNVNDDIQTKLENVFGNLSTIIINKEDAS